MIEFDLHDLRSAFAACARVADGRRTAVLGNVLVEDRDDVAHLFASDGENYIRVSCETGFGGSYGAKFLLPVSRMLPILATATSDVVIIGDDGSSIEIECGQASFHLPKQDPAEFPAMPSLDGDCVEVRIARAELSLSLIHI